MNNDSAARGISAEEMVIQAFEHEKEGGEFKITEIIRSPRNSWYDRNQVDLRTKFQDGIELLFQVKSGWCGAKKFEKWARRKGRFILLILARIGDSMDVIRRRVREKIRLGYAIIARKVNATIHQARENGDDEGSVARQRRRSEQHFRRVHTFRMCH